MKLCTFQTVGEAAATARLGAVLEAPGAVVDLQAASAPLSGREAESYRSMLDLLDGGEAAMDQTRALMERVAKDRPDEVVCGEAAVSLLAPLPRPRSIRDCMSFEGHLVQATRTVVKWRAPLLAAFDAWWEKRRGRALLAPPKVWYQRPIYYKGNPFSVVGHEHEVRWPSYTEKLDYELEFGIVMGRGGCNIKESDALDHVAGYTIFNDFSARDVQLSEMQGRLGPTKGKDFDTGNVLGPYLVTPDEVGDPYQLSMAARINGETWSEANSADMHYRFEQLIAYISRDETLQPGEFIAAGTAPNGCGLELDRWLQPGDVVELEVERLGVLRNRVVR